MWYYTSVPFKKIIPLERPIKAHVADSFDRFVSLYFKSLDTIHGHSNRVVNRATLYVNELENEDEFGNNKIIPLQQTEILAIKSILRRPNSEERELDLLLSMDHPNIIKLKYYFEATIDKSQYMNLIMEYLPHPLDKCFIPRTRKRKRLDEVRLKSYAKQLLSGLEYIHSKNICHRDLEPRNILLSADKSILKICDFGNAKILVPNEKNVIYENLSAYNAPEMMLGDAYYTTALDIWSCACVLATNIKGDSLFTGSESEELMMSIVKVIGPPDEKMKPKILKLLNLKDDNFFSPSKLKEVLDCPYEEYVNLIESMLIYSPDSRPTAAKLLNLSYFNVLLDYLKKTRNDPNILGVN